MAKRESIELWACIDARGDYAAGKSEEEAREKYEEDIGPLAECSGFRLVKLTVSVPLPEPVELSGEASDVETATLSSVS